MAHVSLQLPLFVALVFLIISSPFVYKMTNQLSTQTVKVQLADSTGAPTRAGMIVHGLVVFAIMYGYLKTNP